MTAQSLKIQIIGVIFLAQYKLCKNYNNAHLNVLICEHIWTYENRIVFLYHKVLFPEYCLMIRYHKYKLLDDCWICSYSLSNRKYLTIIWLRLNKCRKYYCRFKWNALLIYASYNCNVELMKCSIDFCFHKRDERFSSDF